MPSRLSDLKHPKKHMSFALGKKKIIFFLKQKERVVVNLLLG